MRSLAAGAQRPCAPSSRLPAPRAPRRACAAFASASASSSAATGGVPDAKVVVIGGTGRVGSATASALLQQFPNLEVTLASRSDASYAAAVARRPNLRKAAFKAVDITDAASVKVGRGEEGR
ncbi:hypothetical protein TSOC_014224 [Tetrabaena socialis]|uniref:Saccharopine dehydrogenase NADP binding domain-containing protein n=1 Tax=Tetrabaena socialis TaxID=47790 RepID=A0A2J7ZI89_9CHLO|nr:hypothetical protein TSOC_014224 [Tetrabaena socialis]|eukprot:PNG99978.1 hypothetical protein TSOC_014224 [Tetrabaena socialis]